MRGQLRDMRLQSRLDNKSVGRIEKAHPSEIVLLFPPRFTSPHSPSQRLGAASISEEP